MKAYSRDEKDAVKENLPKPLVDFLGSEALSNIYIGIQKKFKFNLRQLMLMAEVANTTLMGLEAESATETNIHELLPELSNETTRELVADINDRVFKEARRRLQENITEPGPEWDEEALGPKEGYKRLLNSAELKEHMEEEERTGKKTATVPVNDGAPPPEEASISAPEKTEVKIGPSDTSAGAPLLRTEENLSGAKPSEVKTNEKLQAPTATKPEEVSVDVSQKSAGESASRTVDPYRETIE